MARYTGPKHKLARREGVNILDKVSSSLERRLNVRPGVHGHKRGRKLSEYGIELREKQKAKRIYGVLERQFNKYYKEALKKRGETGSALLRLLETRLDNLVYRLRLAPTRPMARQLVKKSTPQII
ncbi:30S ribosomal protein S4 [Candidatus Microgenomates bacterium]|nr:30S ribosomal protein S4 [Candidatus Microgenomates bacterium]